MGEPKKPAAKKPDPPKKAEPAKKPDPPKKAEAAKKPDPPKKTETPPPPAAPKKPDAPQSEKLDWDKTQFRFTVKSPEGQEVKVAIIPWPRPAAGSAGAGANAPSTAAAPRPDPSALKNPQWSSAAADAGTRFQHGDHAQMQVEAPGHDGKKVKFIVEQRIGGNWRLFQTVTGVVKNGVAQAKVKAQHPSAGKPGAPLQPHVMRFRNVFA